MMNKMNVFLKRLSPVFFGSRKAAFISALFGIAVLALLYVAYRQVEEAAQIELPTGQADIKKTKDTTASQEVLVINSYHVGHVWSENEMTGIIGILKEASPKIRYNIEYLDCKHYPKYEHFETVKDLFRLKYGSRVIPVVMVTDNPALEFALKYRALLFPRSAIVFCGVNNYKKEMLGGQDNITGLAEALDADGTMRIALTLHPGTREVFVIHDYTSTGLATRGEAEEQLKGKFGQISFRYVEDMTKKELTQLLKVLPKDSLVLALAYNVFRDGEVIGHEDMAGLLSAHSPVPVYGVHQERLGYGIVGGSLLSGRLHGAEAARVALRILSGTPASYIPVVMKPPTRMMFDYNQLGRFGTALKALPEDSVVVNRPVSFISSHKYLVVSTLLVIIILICGIIILGLNVYQRGLAEEGLRKAKEELEIHVSERTTELLNANEQLYYELGERKKVEEALKKSEQRLQLHVRQTPLAVIEWDTDFHVLSWNPAAETIFGYSSAEALGRHAEFIVPVSSRPHVDRIWSDLLLHRGGERSTNENVTKDNRTILCEWYNTPLITFDGRVIGVASLVQDITERKRSEEALRAERGLFVGGPAVVFKWKAEEGWPVEYVSPNVKDQFGHTPEDLTSGKVRYAAIVHPDDLARLAAEVSAYSEQGVALFEQIYRIARTDGSYRWIDDFTTVIRGRDGTITHYLGYILDITERKRSEEALNRLNEELEQRFITRTADLEKKSLELQDSQRALMNIVDDLNNKTEELEQANVKLKDLDRLKSMFIASMSHELRTPLNSIIGFSSILHDGWIGPVNAEQMENLATILRSGKHLLNLINDVIDISKIEAGKIECKIEDFDLSDVIQEAVNLVTGEMKSKGLSLTVDAVSVRMHTDRRRLLQCVINLLSNAVKFTEKGSVRIHARKGGEDFAEISVEDTGIGIKEEDLPKLFGSFVRLDSPLRSTVKGTGLGLYLTKKLITEVLKGDIICISRYGEGSVFTIRIPVRPG